MYITRLLSATVPAIIAAAALAASPAVELTTKVWKEKRTASADGTTSVTLVSSPRAVPGDRLVYTISYRNRTTAPVAGIVVDDPLPAGVMFVAPVLGSASPELSVDGRTFGPLASLTKAGAPGAQPATNEDVTHLRWRIPGATPAGGGGEVSFKAVLK